MNVCKNCGQTLIVCFHRDFNVFCDAECANEFDEKQDIKPAEQPFDAEEVHWSSMEGAL